MWFFFLLILFLDKIADLIIHVIVDKSHLLQFYSNLLIYHDKNNLDKKKLENLILIYKFFFK
jgi:hypothetical protein